ncbi:MAG: TVP38/TMEM64 family protein [Gammaproteobacteria bacterium]|nr:TVP38/TMEM64 family protein [Gammaproteobacteria bacterium]
MSLPVAGILSITGGALFGLLWGTILVSIAGATGATIAFLLSRYLFREYVQTHYGDRLTAINEGIKENGNIYLLTMRLVPVIPYFIINAAMGITPMPVYTFSLITLFGMVPITTVLVNGGAQIASINTIQDIMSIKVIFSFVLIGLIPIIAHKVKGYINTK